MRYTIILIVMISAVTVQANDTSKTEMFSELISRMTGSFSSAEQAANDTDFFDIRLEMKPIWTDRSYNGVYIYVEQAAAGYLDKPYRQRVYYVYQVDEGQYVSEVYTFDDPLRFAGVFTEDQPLESLSPDSLSPRLGCAIYLTIQDSLFIGSTQNSECKSELRGASYATSQVEIAPDYLYSWDQGFDSTGVQVWGARKSGYIFKKVQ